VIGHEVRQLGRGRPGGFGSASTAILATSRPHRASKARLPSLAHPLMDNVKIVLRVHPQSIL
jgi:hypothetical protein